MKFLIIAPRFHTNLYYRAIALIKANHKVKVLVLYSGKSEYHEDIEVEKLSLSFFSKVLLAIIKPFKRNQLKNSIELRIQSPNRKIKDEIRRFKPDVILLKAYQNMLAVKTLIISKRYRIKVLMFTQTVFTHIKGSTFLFRLNIKLFSYLGVYAYITPIESNYNAFKNFGIQNVFYIPFVFQTKKMLANNLLAHDKIRIITVGKFTKRKDHLLLIKAVKSLSERGFKIELSVYGEIADGEFYEKLSNYVINNNLTGIVSFFSNIPYLAMLNAYKQHDIFVLASYSEPAAYSPVEAMANGLPVILSDQCGTKCYIEEGSNGFIFKAKKVESLVEKLLFLVSDKNRIQDMGKESAILAHKNHSMNVFVDNIMEIVDEKIK